MNNDESPLADTEVHYLRSLATGGEFKLFVGRCGLAADGDRPAATLYLTDGNGYFGMAVDLIRSMQLVGHLPPMLVVGIGYRVGGLAETQVLRMKDLTPSTDPAYTRLFPDQAEQGGARQFLRFIREELIPWVDARYVVQSGERALFGHSLGGLFGTYVLLQAPDTFARYIISSPSLWWHGNVMNTLEEAYASSHEDLPARVYLGIGSDESHDGRRREAANLPDEARRLATAWYIDMVDDLLQLVARLEGRGFPNLDLTSKVFADEFHVTVPQLTFSRGLRTLFDAPW